MRDLALADYRELVGITAKFEDAFRAQVKLTLTDPEMAELWGRRHIENVAHYIEELDELGEFAAMMVRLMEGEGDET